MHSWVNLFYFFSVLVLFFNPDDMRSLQLSSSSDGKLFELQSVPQGYLTFLGDSHLLYNGIALTKIGMPTDAPGSAGMVLYRNPIFFLDPHSKKVPSFSTMFAFSIENLIYGDGEASGDGLTFFISPDNDFFGSPGYLGLVDSTNLTRNKFIAIEFDTKCDPMFQDPDNNHVGLDINSLSSVQLATSFALGVNLKSGTVINAWIDYKSDEKRLEVFLIDSNLKHEKPEKPLLKFDIDLHDYLKENMFVGFSAAATEGSMQLTRILQWEFTIVEFSPPPPPPSASPLGRTFSNPSEAGHKHSHITRFAIGIIVGVCSVAFVIVFGWIFRKKLMGMIQKSEGKNYLKMQTISSSGGTSCQAIRLSIPNTNPDEVVRGLVLEKVLDNEAEIIHVKTEKPSSPLPQLLAYDITSVDGRPQQSFL